MTTYGFFSVTESQDNPQELMVRARKQEHIQKLQVKFPQLRKIKLHDWPNRDYRFRLFVTRDVWKRVMLGLIDDTDFSNFKSAVGERNDGDEAKYLSALHATWHTMAKLQPTPPYNRGINETNQQLAFRSYYGKTLECKDCGQLYPSDGGDCYCGASPTSGFAVTVTAK
jgi:hypothetical protein